MSFFNGLSEGWDDFKRTVSFAFKNPLLLLPMLFAVAGVVTVVYYGITVYSIMDQDWYVIIFAYVCTVTVIVSISSLILLELIEQKEQGRRMNVFKAVFDALVFDLWRTLPVIVVWSILKFIVTVLEIIVMIAKSKNNKDRDRGIVSTYSRNDRRLRRTQSFLDVISTGVRLASMTILTSIAWESLNPFKAMKKGVDVYTSHIGNIVAGVGLSNLFKFLMFIPSFGVLYFAYESGSGISNELLFGVMVYFGFVWAITLMIEQVYVAELYIWHMGYEKEVDKAIEEGREIPKSMYKIRRPSLFDDIAEFQEDYKKTVKEKY